MPRPDRIGSWVGPMASMDGRGKSGPHRNSTPDRPTRSASLYRLSYPGPSVQRGSTKYIRTASLNSGNYIHTRFYVRTATLNKIKHWQVFLLQRSTDIYNDSVENRIKIFVIHTLVSLVPSVSEVSRWLVTCTD
jgi:hypothetical protein